MIKTNKDSQFPELGIQINTTLYTSAGDKTEISLSRPGIKRLSYGRRHLKIGRAHV